MILGELGEQLASRIETLELDVSNQDSVQRAREQFVSRHSELHCLINNAGVALDMPWNEKPFKPCAASDTLSTNFQGAVNCCTAFIPLLRKGGRVVNVSSGGGLANTQRMSEGRRDWLLRMELTMDELQEAVKTFIRLYEQAAPGGDLPKLAEEGWWLHAYGFSKAALNAYTRILARENPNILVNACSPGFILTDMTAKYADAGKLKTADEGSCANTPIWLALSDIHGATGRYFADGFEELAMDGSGPVNKK